MLRVQLGTVRSGDVADFGDEGDDRCLGRPPAYPARTNIKLTKPARDLLNYLRDVTFNANDQSAAIELAAGRITGSYTPWVQSGHVWSPAAKGARGRGK